MLYTLVIECELIEKSRGSSSQSGVGRILLNVQLKTGRVVCIVIVKKTTHGQKPGLGGGLIDPPGGTEDVKHTGGGGKNVAGWFNYSNPPPTPHQFAP